jgi:hypothetical protein
MGVLIGKKGGAASPSERVRERKTQLAWETGASRGDEFCQGSVPTQPRPFWNCLIISLLEHPRNALRSEGHARLGCCKSPGSSLTSHVASL